MDAMHWKKLMVCLGVLWAAVMMGWIGPVAAQSEVSWTGAGADKNWFNDENWDPVGRPGPGAAVTVSTADTIMLTNATAELASFTMDAGTLVFTNWHTKLQATNVFLEGGTLTLPPSFTDIQMSNRVWIVCSNLVLESAAEIDAEDRGYQSENGPGQGGGETRGGGGHGGRGAMLRTWSDRGLTYGDVSAPLAPGSGGANPDRSRSGGGAVRIQAFGEVSIHGTVNVDGGDHAIRHGSGGSGGSIYISCRTFTGSSSGLLTARGGNASSEGGAGGGGRIAVVYDGDAQRTMTPVNASVRFSAAPGTGGSHAFLAQPGTLFLPDSQFLSGHLTEQWDDVQLYVPGLQQWEIESLNVTGRIGFPEIERLVVTNDLTIADGGRISFYGPVTNTPALEDGMHLDIGGEFTVADGGRLVLTSNPSNGAPPFITCDRLTVESGGHIDADYRGFASTGAGEGDNNGPGGGRGAGHGGYGSMGEWSWSTRGSPYGDPEAPVLPGSGGSGSDRSGYGGGAVIIKATDTVTVRGTISANGQGATRAAGHGGSGGAIYIRCRTFHGNAQGFLSVQGGNPMRTGDGWGAGGRIAVVYDPAEQAALPQPNPGVRFSAAGWADHGSSMPRLAETGTLYLPEMETLFLSSHMTAQWDDVDLHIPGFTTWQVPALEISGRFGIRGLEILHVDGDLTMAADGRFTLYSGPTNAARPNVGARIHVGGGLVVQPDATLMLCATNGVGPYIECGSLWVHPGGQIRADKRGPNPEEGQGHGTSSGGGGYGGAGARAGGGQPYGEAFAPVAPGSGGGNADRGGRGGGLVRISARGAMRVDGTIRAVGMQNSRALGGAGSGGGVLLSAAGFSGSGTLRASGGDRDPGNGGGGGGGRIAVWQPYIPLPFMENMAAGYFPGIAETLDPAVEYPDLLLSVAAGSGGSAQEGTIFFGRIARGTMLMVR